MSARPNKQRTRSAAKSSSGHKPAKAHDHSATKESERASKQSRVIAMLRSPNGVTISAMMKETDWQQHSVRGFLAGVVRKRLKLQLDSRLVDGSRLYRIIDSTTKSTATGKTKHR